ncbi:hypothetical protein N0V84_009865 [Fusarium piperis]|uniref:UDP-3-O-acyl-N-acetylglucosamine deacetylase n=1 Tax=Fusarium piperis TaxID=1435070 RepID=A0A9W8W5I8_9HYPO|nr:hypothetical protein N0V84_009865 [Fusarium piperis]
MALQQTISKPIEFSGVGVHSGQKATVRLLPAPENHGVVFVRTDLEPPAVIPGTSSNTSSASLATTLGCEPGRSVATVEHLLAALVGIGVDNLRVEVDGKELPILDGSAEPYAKELVTTGLQVQNQPRRYLIVRRKVQVQDGQCWASIEPSNTGGLTIECSLDFEHPVIGKINHTVHITPLTFLESIAPARTFGFLKDAEALQSRNLALGASMHNTVLLDGDSVVNEEGLRFPDEFVRHKILDTMGDLSLLGLPVIGHGLFHELRE